jgi:sarcosine oxidase gamma subunit
MDTPSFRTLLARVGAMTQGCCVDQSGGLWVLKATGARVSDLLLRVGSCASVAAPGSAQVTRIAEVPVMTLCVNPGETLLIVERVYAEHLLGWIRATAADFEPVA